MRVVRVILAVAVSTLAIFCAQSAQVASADPPGMTHDGIHIVAN